MYVRLAWSVNKDPSPEAVKWSSRTMDSTTAKASFSTIFQLKEDPVNDPERNERGSWACPSMDISN